MRADRTLRTGGTVLCQCVNFQQASDEQGLTHMIRRLQTRQVARNDAVCQSRARSDWRIQARSEVSTARVDAEYSPCESDTM